MSARTRTHDHLVRRHRLRRRTAVAGSWAVWTIVVVGCAVSGWNWTAAQTLQEHGPMTVAAVAFNLTLAAAGIVGVWGCLLDIATAGVRGESAFASVARLPGGMGAGYGAGLLVGMVAHPSVTDGRSLLGVTAAAMLVLGALLLALPTWIARGRRTR